MESSALLVFFLAAITLVGLAMLFSSYVPPTSKNSAKFEPYECGIETVGDAWLQYTVGYYLFAILFLIFDVETIFLFPWAIAMKTAGIAGFVEILIFFAILGLGLLYGWKKHALRWE